MSESLTICSLGMSEGETSSSHSEYEKTRPVSPSKSDRVNLRTKKNLRLKRRPTGVFTVHQLNPSSSVSETSDCEDDEYTASVQSNTLYNETTFDFASSETSTVETSCRVEESTTQDVLDDGEEDEEEYDESEVESTVEERNQRLKDQLRLKELYIKQLEDRLRSLEMKQCTPKRRNLCAECHSSFLDDDI